jgi:DNA-binding CsgD family transcriptional regulator
VGAVEHLKTLCCLGLPRESALIAVTPLLHEIIPHGATRFALLEPDATIGCGYNENPDASVLLRERLWALMQDPSGPGPLWLPGFRAGGIGWTLPMQTRRWLDSRWVSEIERPLDSCWILDAMIVDGGQSIAFLELTRPRSARPFVADDVQLLDRLRPWLAHALRGGPGDGAEDPDFAGAAGAPVLSGRMVFTVGEKMILQTKETEHLLRIIAGEPGDFTRRVPVRDKLPAPILKLFRRIAGAANGSLGEPPRMQVSTPYGVVTLEAEWLLPANTIPADVARDPKSCLISVTIELREHALAHAARVLRESGATPAQMKVGIELAVGKSKPVIADALGIELSSVASLAKKLYQTLDIHNSAELASKIWLGESQDDLAISKFPEYPALMPFGARQADNASIFAPNYKRLAQR